MKIATSMIRDKVEITDVHGELLKVFPYTFNVAQGFARVDDLRLQMVQLNAAGNMEELGKATVALLQAVFGEETYAEMDQFYNGDYVTMLNDLAPVLTEEIYPAIAAYRERMIAARKRVKA